MDDDAECSREWSEKEDEPSTCSDRPLCGARLPTFRFNIRAILQRYQTSQGEAEGTHFFADKMSPNVPCVTAVSTSCDVGVKLV